MLHIAAQRDCRVWSLRIQDQRGPLPDFAIRGAALRIDRQSTPHIAYSEQRITLQHHSKTVIRDFWSHAMRNRDMEGASYKSPLSRGCSIVRPSSGPHLLDIHL
jgi:hypothetical protein